ncbi:MAG: ABC transporter permease, partial [Anaerolineales bacterium]|nr:ABC transporter permease [Anaerolineales bacterium]
MVKRIWSLVIKDFTHLIRDWWLPAFMLFGGVLELLLIGWATSRPITNLPIMILDQDQTPASRELITALENTTTFSISHYAAAFDEIESALERGSINAAIIIPNNYGSETTAQNGNPTIAVILNGAESTAA